VRAVLAAHGVTPPDVAYELSLEAATAQAHRALAPQGSAAAA
jgi:hypothetical protein